MAGGPAGQVGVHPAADLLRVRVEIRLDRHPQAAGLAGPAGLLRQLRHE